LLMPRLPRRGIAEPGSLQGARRDSSYRQRFCLGAHRLCRSAQPVA
jgi:hypothetical protein